MATEFTVKLKHKTGTLAELGIALGYANINIDAIQGMPLEGQGLQVRLLSTLLFLKSHSVYQIVPSEFQRPGLADFD